MRSERWQLATSHSPQPLVGVVVRLAPLELQIEPVERFFFYFSSDAQLHLLLYRATCSLVTVAQAQPHNSTKAHWVLDFRGALTVSPVPTGGCHDQQTQAIQLLG